MRDLGIFALGMLAGAVLASYGMYSMATDVERTDRLFRGLRLRWNARTEGQG